MNPRVALEVSRSIAGSRVAWSCARHPDPETRPCGVRPINLGCAATLRGRGHIGVHMAPHDAHSAPPPALEVDFGRPSIALVRLRGDHDLSGKQRLGEALSTAGARLNVLVDLSECTFMDSSVIAALFLARARLAERGGRLELVIPHEAIAVRRVADVTVLQAILPIHETLSAAVAGLQIDRHAIHLRDLRLRFGDPESRAAHCSCGWQGVARGGPTAGRTARRDGVEHVDQEHLAASGDAATTTPDTTVLVP